MLEKFKEDEEEAGKNFHHSICCCYSNLIDSYSSFFPFLVKPEKTRLTINTDITKPVQFGSFVTLNCTTHARPDPDGYKFYRGQELLSSNGSGVFDLRLQRSGLYSCLPFNSAGDGDQASLKIIVDGRLRLVVKTFFKTVSKSLLWFYVPCWKIWIPESINFFFL